MAPINIDQKVINFLIEKIKESKVINMRFFKEAFLTFLK